MRRCADKADAINDLARIEIMAGSIGVEFIEVIHAHGQVGVGEEFDRLGFSAVGEYCLDVYVLLSCTLPQ